MYCISLFFLHQFSSFYSCNLYAAPSPYLLMPTLLQMFFKNSFPSLPLATKHSTPARVKTVYLIMSFQSPQRDSSSLCASSKIIPRTIQHNTSKALLGGSHQVWKVQMREDRDRLVWNHWSLRQNIHLFLTVVLITARTGGLPITPCGCQFRRMTRLNHRDQIFYSSWFLQLNEQKSDGWGKEACPSLKLLPWPSFCKSACPGSLRNLIRDDNIQVKSLSSASPPIWLLNNTGKLWASTNFLQTPFYCFLSISPTC